MPVRHNATLPGAAGTRAERSVRGRNMQKTYEFQGVSYLRGSAGSLILACPKCGEEHFREPENYFWSLVPENKARLKEGQKNYWGDPSWHKCMTCETQMEPIRVDELDSRWKPFWRSLGRTVTESSNAVVSGAVGIQSTES